MGFKFLEIRKAPSEELLELLNNNIIGTPGHGMLYQHLGVHNKIHKIANPYYVNLVRGDKIIGTACFCSRNMNNAGLNLPAYYIRYFSFKHLFRRKSISEKSVTGNSALRAEIKSVLTGEGLEKEAQETFFHYAYVDPRNIRSLVLCNEFGFEPVRQYTSLIFNRIHPKTHAEAALVTPSEEDNIKTLLAEFYKEYTMFSFENLFNGRPYYVLKDSTGRIVAGVQVNLDRWKIYSLPGLSGKIILNTFSKVPYLNRLFNTNYRFITLEGIYYSKGAERCLEVLFESLLAQYKVNSALICLDADSDLYRALKSLKLG
ncbi:MAG: hypothetical protein K2Q22_16445, partial [Cytophagales bacterium]|nr:hypothetical protein [Cytophagales bacterium]